MTMRQFGFLQIVKEHATLSAGASADHGAEVENEVEHVNRATDRVCCVSSCSASSIHYAVIISLWVRQEMYHDKTSELPRQHREPLSNILGQSD